VNLEEKIKMQILAEEEPRIRRGGELFREKF
jgi:hypothetical protein